MFVPFILEFGLCLYVFVVSRVSTHERLIILEMGMCVLGYVVAEGMYT